MSEKHKDSWSFLDGVIRHNPVFIAGMSLAPVIILSNDLNSAVLYAVVFTSVTAITLMLSSFVSKKIPYALRIMLYCLISALVYIPVYIHINSLFEEDLAFLGVFLPMIVTGEFLVSAAELRFFRMPRKRMYADIFSHIIGLDTAIVLLGFVRELFSTGEIDGRLFGVHLVSPVLGYPCGGFILIGLTGALIRLCTRNKEG